MLTPGIALITPIAKLIADMKPLIIPQAVDNTVLTALETTPLIALPTTSPTLLNIPVIFFHIPLKKSVIGLNKLYASLIEEEKRTTAKKKRIKGKLIKMLKSKIVLNREMFKNYDNIFHPENDKEKIKIRLALLKREKAKERKISSERNHLKVKSTPDLFSSVKVSFRYEDLYLSPEEILGNYFSKEEIPQGR